MSTSALLLIALASVVLLLLLVIKAKAHPFVALLIVSLLVAFATGIPADKIITTIEKGMGGLLGHIASIIILGSMLGVLIEMSGGAESLAKTLTGVLGAKRTIAALTIVAFILGTPVFFEVGFIIIIPLIYGFSKVAHVSPLKFGLPMAGVMLTVHVALPTHPGAAAAAGILHSDVGWLMLAGIGVSVVVGIVGYFVARFINRRHYHLSINVLEQQQTAEVPDLSVNAQQTRLPPPNALVIGGLIVVPIMLIVSGTLCQALLLPENAVRQLMTVIGTPPVALLISLGLASWTLGIRRRMSLKKLGEVTGSAIPSSADVILVAGAGGAFGGVLVASGIGNALAEALETIHLPLMPAAFSAIAGAQSLAGFGHRGDPHHLRSAVAGGCRSGAAAAGAGDAGDLLRLARAVARQRRRILGRHAVSRTLGAGWTQNLDRLDNHHGGDGLSHHLAAVVCALMLTWVAPATLTSPRHRP